METLRAYPIGHAVLCCAEFGVGPCERIVVDLRGGSPLLSDASASRMPLVHYPASPELITENVIALAVAVDSRWHSRLDGAPAWTSLSESFSRQNLSTAKRCSLELLRACQTAAIKTARAPTIRVGTMRRVPRVPTVKTCGRRGQSMAK